MARPYAHVVSLAGELRGQRERRSLSFNDLGRLSGVDGAQAFRICRGEFKTLNPSVLKICNALGVRPQSDGWPVLATRPNQNAEMLATEVLAAWDHTDTGAKKLQRVLRALRD